MKWKYFDIIGINNSSFQSTFWQNHDYRMGLNQIMPYLLSCFIKQTSTFLIGLYLLMSIFLKNK